MLTDTFSILGAGGHARVVIDALSAARPDLAIRVFDDSPSHVGSTVLGFEVECWSDEALPDGVVHVGIGNNRQRRDRIRRLVAAGVEIGSVLSVAATVARSAVLGDGIFVAAGAIIAPESSIGRASIINHNAVVDHQAMVGEYCHIAPGATIAGQCRIGDGTLVAAGAQVLPGIQVGSGVTIGAGAVITRDVGDGRTVVGVPAR